MGLQSGDARIEVAGRRLDADTGISEAGIEARIVEQSGPFAGDAHMRPLVRLRQAHPPAAGKASAMIEAAVVEHTPQAAVARVDVTECVARQPHVGLSEPSVDRPYFLPKAHREGIVGVFLPVGL